MIARLSAFVVATAALGAMLVAPATSASAHTTTTPATTSSASTSSASKTGRPTAGTCRAMTLAVFQGAYDTSKTVPCSRWHTAYTYAVATLPSSLDLKKATEAQIVTASDRACESKWLTYRGATALKQAVASYDPGFFMPTAAQIQHGARWAECDVVIPWAHRDKLVALPSKLPVPLLVGTQRLSAQRCLDGSLYEDPCNQKHRWHAVHALNFKHSGYPTAAQFKKAARVCQSYTHSTRWVYTMPSKPEWQAGYHVMVCFKPTTK